MFESLEALGCTVKDRAKFVSCSSCDMDLTGGFNSEDASVVLCQNHLVAKNGMEQEQVNQTMVHELVHAYDQCRAHVDWSVCDQHACSEVRAAGLSGECDWKHELNRGNFNIAGQHQACVRRRAELSLQMNPNCAGAQAAEAVERVFVRCYKDTAPFEKRM